MLQNTEINDNTEKVVLVGIITGKESESRINEYLDELEFLVETAGGQTIARFTQKLEKPEPSTFIGSGKLQEVAEFVKAAKIDIVIFDDELNASQIRNIERGLDCRILDRTNLILDIFARRARTSYAKTQVELAQYEYLLPRLTRMWTHLGRQRGGIGLRGPGETEIETDRRIIRDRISVLKKKLEQIDKQMATQRKTRGKIVRVALVGYTNVGKSTIMNQLSKSDLFAENKLFATLDTTVRKVVIYDLPFLLSDTVGFIRKLPHSLIESFKSTLDEVREADLIIHVVDISHPNFEEQISTVNQTLAEIGAFDKPVIMVFNKTDAYRWIEKEEDDLTPIVKENIALEDLKKTWMANFSQPTLFVSALKKENWEELKNVLYQKVKEIHISRYPYTESPFYEGI
ncbi:MAG: GTPase HflX [Bacteroidales bacterium]|jgi:GTP-binding protein HflX|nr:GTPase HflX [Bacteroidales bacterium]MDI9592090.1 GTPase HflX [Bacteroidota bacterium]OQC36500.1 MAG: GTPase HflX [Bacteroidetes bacterium ADurb.Bin041]HNV50801.1 GTPase HflX [Bacteroidales bacterium]HNY60181.1 GTPase HflX [Bacteroidales bacterium]